MSRPVIRRYPTGETGPLGGRTERFGTPRPGHGHVWITYRSEEKCSALWQDEYPEPDESGARVGHASFEGDYEAVVAWARATPAEAVYVAWPALPVPGTPAEARIGYQPLKPTD